MINCSCKMTFPAPNFHFHRQNWPIFFFPSLTIVDHFCSNSEKPLDTNETPLLHLEVAWRERARQKLTKKLHFNFDHLSTISANISQDQLFAVFYVRTPPKQVLLFTLVYFGSNFNISSFVSAVFNVLDRFDESDRNCEPKL